MKQLTMFWAGLLSVLCLSGCGWTVRVNYLRAAAVSLSAQGNTVTVEDLPPAEVPGVSETIAGEVRGGLSNSLNAQLRLVTEGGGAIVRGRVLHAGYQEEVQRVEQTCSDNVSVSSNTSVGNRNATTTQTTTIRYPCTMLRRYGVARVEAALEVLDARTGESLLSRNVWATREGSTQGSERRGVLVTPAPLDAHSLLIAAAEGVGGRFVSYLVPSAHWSQVDLEGCPGDERCERGYQAARHGQWQLAEALFHQVVGTYDPINMIPPQELSERIANALFDRGVARLALGRPREAVMDLQRAVQFRSGRDAWFRVLQQAQELVQENEALRVQGAIL